jgi:hypothetical protein
MPTQKRRTNKTKLSADQLAKSPGIRGIQPADLRGEAKAEFDRMVHLHVRGQLNHKTLQELWEWAKDNCGTTTSYWTFCRLLRHARSDSRTSSRTS